MSTEDNIILVRRYFDEVLNPGNLDAARALFASNHIAHYPSYPPIHGYAEWKQNISTLHTAFPDMHTAIEDEIVTEDKVVVRYTVRATHLGVFENRPATGRSVKFTGIGIFQVANGKIVEQWHEANALGMRQQLGI